MLLRPLAIKHLSDRTRPVAARRFRREAQTIARLNHPTIVQIYDLELELRATTRVAPTGEGVGWAMAVPGSR